MLLVNENKNNLCLGRDYGFWSLHFWGPILSLYPQLSLSMEPRVNLTQSGSSINRNTCIFREDHEHLDHHH